MLKKINEEICNLIKMLIKEETGECFDSKNTDGNLVTERSQSHKPELNMSKGNSLDLIEEVSEESKNNAVTNPQIQEGQGGQGS